MSAMDEAHGEFGQARSLLEDDGVILKSLKVEIGEEPDQQEETLAMVKEKETIIEQDLNVKSCISTNSESTANMMYSENLVNNFETTTWIKIEPCEENPDLGNYASDDAVLLKSPKVEIPDEEDEEELAMVKEENMFIGSDWIKSEPSEETPELGNQASDDSLLLKLLKAPKVEKPNEQDEEEEESLAMVREKMIIEQCLKIKSRFSSSSDAQYSGNNLKKEWINIEVSEETPDLGNSASGADVGVFSIPTLPHGVSFEPDKTFVCNDCGQLFDKKIRLIRHIKSHNATSKVYVNCPECDYRALSRDTLERHLRLHDNTRPHQCAQCNYRYVSKGHLQQHVKSQHSVDKESYKIHSCNVCVYKTSRLSNLKQHLKTHTGEKPFSCSVCGHKFSKKNHLERHMQIHTGEKPFSRQMDTNGSKKCDLKAPVKRQRIEKQLPCSVCPRMFSQTSDLETHMRIHAGEKPYTCSVCAYTCFRKSDLKRHVRTHTGEKPFSCHMCTYQCSQKQNLKAHMLIHTGEKPFSCPACGNKFSKNSHLKRHMQVHTGEKTLSCHICTFQCTQKHALKAHMISHAHEKPFACTLCAYICSRKSNLMTHMRSHHTGDEKLFSCSVCEQMFSEEGNFKAHMIRHSVEKPFSCSMCTHKCSRESALKRHIRRNHTDTEEKPLSSLNDETSLLKKYLLSDTLK